MASSLKYVTSQKNSSKVKKKRNEEAIFPDSGGDDESDSSSRLTFYDICRTSSTSTIYSEQSSVDSGNKSVREPVETVPELGNENVVNQFHTLSTTDNYVRHWSLTTPKTITRLSTIDIQVISALASRPSCSTAIRDDLMEHEQSFDYVTEDIQKREGEIEENTNIVQDTKAYVRTAANTNSEKKHVLSLPSLPSIDIVAPSPSLSVFSDRHILTEEQFESLLHPTCSRLSQRTLTPLSSLSSASSTMSEYFSSTPVSDDGQSGTTFGSARKRILPPIKKRLEEKSVSDNNTTQTTTFEKFRKNISPINRHVVINHDAELKTSTTNVSVKVDTSSLKRETRFQRSKQKTISKLEPLGNASINKDNNQKDKESPSHSGKDRVRKDSKSKDLMYRKKSVAKFHSTTNSEVLYTNVKNQKEVISKRPKQYRFQFQSSEADQRRSSTASRERRNCLSDSNSNDMTRFQTENGRQISFRKVWVNYRSNNNDFDG